MESETETSPGSSPTRSKLSFSTELQSWVAVGIGMTACQLLPHLKCWPLPQVGWLTTSLVLALVPLNLFVFVARQFVWLCMKSSHGRHVIAIAVIELLLKSTILSILISLFLRFFRFIH